MEPYQELVDLGKRLGRLGRYSALALIYASHVIVQLCILFYVCWLSTFTFFLSLLEKMTERIKYRKDSELLSIL